MSEPGFDWSDLRYFLAVARAKSLAGAARSLEVEHTTVSRRVAALEAALGVKLFTRGPDGYALTSAGAAIVGSAEQIEEAARCVVRRVAGEDERVDGTVRLTTSEGLSGFLVKRLAPLRARHPDLLVEVLVGNRAFDLMRGEADLALRFSSTDQGDLIVRKLATVGWSIYASQGYLATRPAPPSPEELTGHDVIGFDDAMAGIPGARWLADHGAGTRVILRGNSIVSVLNACIVGMGVAVLPCFLGDDESTLCRLSRRVLNARDLSLVVHPDLARVARVRVVLDYLAEITAADATLLRGE